MRVLCIYPGMDIAVNDNAYALVYMKDAGVDVAVICSRMCNLKSDEKRCMYEEMYGIPIHRIYEDFFEQTSLPVKRYDQVYRVASQFRPDVILCSVQHNMFIANKLRADLGIPVVLLVEYAYDARKLLERRWYLGIGSLARPAWHVYWRWLSKNSQAIITSFIGDEPHLPYLSGYGTPVYYVPWCNHVPEEMAASQEEKDARRGIYIGSLSPRKNTHEFAVTLPCILDRTPVKEFVVVGPGPGVAEIRELKDRFGERITYIPSVPRSEALKLIRRSHFSYTPVKSGGWGFIGDSWASRTPLVVTHNEYGLRNRIDALIVDRPDHIHLFVNELYENRRTYEGLQEGGFERYQRDHTAQSVGDRLLGVFESVVRTGRGREECGSGKRIQATIAGPNPS